MNFIHLRRKAREYINKKGDKQTDYHPGVVSLAYVISANHALVGVGFCSPLERAFKAKKARTIAGCRLRTDPLHFRVEEEESIESRTLPLLFNTLLIDPPSWLSSNITDGRFSTRWTCQILGPNGTLVRAHIDGHRSDRRYPRTWLQRTPAWVAPFLEEVL